jgi:hypothetical protein
MDGTNDYYDDENDVVDNDNDDDSATDENGLEMEPILHHHDHNNNNSNNNNNNNNNNRSPRGLPIRTASGTWLYARSMSSSPNMRSLSSQQPQPQQPSSLLTRVQHCKSRSGHMAQAAYRAVLSRSSSNSSNSHHHWMMVPQQQRSRSGGPSGGGGIRTMVGSICTGHRRISIWFGTVFGLILMSIALNVLEDVSFTDWKSNGVESRTDVVPSYVNSNDNTNNDNNKNDGSGVNIDINDHVVEATDGGTMTNPIQQQEQQQRTTSSLPPTWAPSILDQSDPIMILNHTTIGWTNSSTGTSSSSSSNRNSSNSNSSASLSSWLWDDSWDPDSPHRKQPPPPHPSSSSSSTAIGDGAAFVEQWCDITGTTWYPVVPPLSPAPPLLRNNITTTTHIRSNVRPQQQQPSMMWQLRAPLFFLPGAAYAGTVYMASLLHQHPYILPARTKELQFFHDRPFRNYLRPGTPEQTLVRPARERMYARDYDTAQLKRNTSYISFDATPGYLYYSTVLPRRILCVTPWVKLVILLRHPVDRILEHYAAYRNMGSQRTLDEYVQEEMQLMQKVGLFNATTMGDHFYGSEDEDLAWYDYQTASTSGGMIGRSLYVIQIRHWIATFRLAGRDPSQAILIVLTENLVQNPQVEYNRILQFMNLPPHVIPSKKLSAIPPSLWLPPPTSRQYNVSNKNNNDSTTTTTTTRQQLENLFRPYNRQLQLLLQQYGISSSSSSS